MNHRRTVDAGNGALVARRLKSANVVPTRVAPSLERLLAELLSKEVESVTVVRSRYSTSFPIDDVTVHLCDGSRLDLVRKDLSWASLLPPAHRGKPAFLYDPRREMRLYMEVLSAAPPGTARCHGVLDDPGAGTRWLFLERLEGVELYQVGDLARWQAAAAWAAHLHVRFEGQVGALLQAGIPLLVHDRDWLQRWAERAVAGATRTNARVLRHLRSRTGVLWARLAGLPTTLVHGELYASNVIVGPPGPEPRVSPVDWEMAAAAPGLIDLAALTAGNWPPHERRSLESAYACAAGRPVDELFDAQLNACRLALCIQWLGWRPRWRAPREHTFDWLGEALVLVERLEL